MAVEVLSRDSRIRYRPRVIQQVALAAHWLILLGLVGVSLLAAIVLDEGSRLFLLKNVLALTLSVLPGSIYLLFISAKGQRLYDEFVINVFRLRIDRLGNLPAPPQHTTYYAEWKKANDHVKAAAGTDSRDNLYRAKFEAIFGSHSVSTRGLIEVGDRRESVRDRTQTFAPILLATFLVGLGWTLVVQPDALATIRLVESSVGAPAVPYEPLQFGFLGAYWFILQDLVRRYFRDDLKTDAYISAVTRLVVVSLLVVTVGLVPVGTLQQQQVFAFLIGVFPQLGLEVLKAGVHTAFGKIVPTLRTKNPLSSLHGLTIWDQARLLEEGIEDLENLATANLVDMLLSMRVPLARLVDWMDQAILLIHLPDGDDTARCALQRLGIRTATDLEAAWAEAAPNGRTILSRAAVGPDATQIHGAAFLGALGRAANIEHIRAFRSHDWLEESEPVTAGSSS
ncbi:MAG: hypothetical protein M4D85_00520 [Actinomycetota bacterium]|nr:hypothetical protein [Actinomycetota bacterium]